MISVNAGSSSDVDFIIFIISFFAVRALKEEEQNEIPFVRTVPLFH